MFLAPIALPALVAIAYVVLPFGAILLLRMGQLEGIRSLIWIDIVDIRTKYPFGQKRAGIHRRLPSLARARRTTRKPSEFRGAIISQRRSQIVVICHLYDRMHVCLLNTWRSNRGGQCRNFRSPGGSRENPKSPPLHFGVDSVIWRKRMVINGSSTSPALLYLRSLRPLWFYSDRENAVSDSMRNSPNITNPVELRNVTLRTFDAL